MIALPRFDAFEMTSLYRQFFEFILALKETSKLDIRMAQQPLDSVRVRAIVLVATGIRVAADQSAVLVVKLPGAVRPRLGRAVVHGEAFGSIGCGGSAIAVLPFVKLFSDCRAGAGTENCQQSR